MHPGMAVVELSGLLAAQEREARRLAQGQRYNNDDLVLFCAAQLQDAFNRRAEAGVGARHHRVPPAGEMAAIHP